MNEIKEVKCRDCGKAAKEFKTYTMLANEDGMEVNDWVRSNDGMYDRKTDTVVCDIYYTRGIMQGHYR